MFDELRQGVPGGLHGLLHLPGRALDARKVRAAADFGRTDASAAASGGGKFHNFLWKSKRTSKGKHNAIPWIC